MRVTIDAGHGGKDSGAIGAGGILEKDIALQFARDLADLLEKEGHEVHLTRRTDVFVRLRDRADAANSFRAHCFVSLHANASVNPSANGAWIIHDDDTRRGIGLAQSIFREVAKVPGAVDQDPDEEVYPDNSPWVGNRELAVLGYTNMPAVLVELGFLTNPGDLSDLRDAFFRRQICQAIKQGISAWAFDEGVLTMGEPEVDLEGDDTFLPPEKDPVFTKVEPWLKPVRQAAAEDPEEPAGLFSVKTLKAFVDSPEAQEVLSPIKKALLNAALAWLEKMLKKFLKLEA